MNNILKAQVVDNTDFSNKGRLLVYCKDINLESFYVDYVSPYSASYEGGFVAIPEIGVEILIAKTGGKDSSWYYIGSLFGNKDGIDLSKKVITDAADPRVPDKEIYRARDIPQRLLIQDPLGNKLVLSHMNVKAEMQSHAGKVLSLVDSPKIDACILKNENGDGIKITSNKSKSSAARSIEIESQGPQKIISKESEIEMIVVEGREIDLKNYSTGKNRDSGDPKKFGNINISSENNDINLTVFEEDGKVFIDALGSDGLIQLDSEGKITIYSENNVEIRAGEDINLKSNGNITLDAGGELNMKSGQGASLESGSSVSMLGSGEISLDGTAIHLNSNKSTPVGGVDVSKEDNNYGN